jgi:hypothetical protein
MNLRTERNSRKERWRKAARLTSVSRAREWDLVGATLKSLLYEGTGVTGPLVTFCMVLLGKKRMTAAAAPLPPDFCKC